MRISVRVGLRWGLLGLLALLVLSGGAAAAVIPTSRAAPGSLAAPVDRLAAPTREQTASGASALVAQLAVLQRPQTPTDVLPSKTKLTAAVRAMLIPSLSRLVASTAGTSTYLVVFSPNNTKLALWNPKLGDLAALLSVSNDGTQISAAVPAADLSDASTVIPVLTGSPSGSHEGVQLVPNGVTRVTWTFNSQHDKPPAVVPTQVDNNVATAPIPTSVFAHANWYANNGSNIPTSDTALVHALAAQQNTQRQQLIRQDEKIRYRPNPKLLTAFKIFGVTSRTGEKVGALIISHPRLTALPLAILTLSENRPDARAHPELDATDIREATTLSGTHIYIVPGEHGLCVFDASGGGCTDNLTQVLAEGVGFSTGGAGQKGVWHYGIKPNNKPTLTITSGPRTHKTFRLSDGVYAYHTGP
jgi:hypothetical protein